MGHGSGVVFWVLLWAPGSMRPLSQEASAESLGAAFCQHVGIAILLFIISLLVLCPSLAGPRWGYKPVCFIVIHQPIKNKSLVGCNK